MKPWIINQFLFSIGYISHRSNQLYITRSRQCLHITGFDTCFNNLQCIWQVCDIVSNLMSQMIKCDITIPFRYSAKPFWRALYRFLTMYIVSKIIKYFDDKKPIKLSKWSSLKTMNCQSWSFITVHGLF